MWVSSSHLGLILKTKIPHFTTADNDDFLVATFSLADISNPTLLKGVGFNTNSFENFCGIHYLGESDKILIAFGSDSRWFVARVDASVAVWSKSTPFGPYTYTAIVVDEDSGLVFFAVDHSS